MNRDFRYLTDTEMDARAQEIKEDYLRRYPKIFDGNEKIFDECLHMFFSPGHVPVGLSEEEIKTSIALYMVIKKLTNDTGKLDLMPTPGTWRNAMTRRAFRRGILIILENLAKMQ